MHLRYLGAARSVRRVILVVFFALCAAIPSLCLVAVFRFLLNPFGAFDGGNEYVGLSGSAAKRCLDSAWPASVDPTAVESVSYKIQYSRDSYSSWFRIRLAEEAARLWEDETHARQERYSKWAMGNQHQAIECIGRTTDHLPRLPGYMVETPSWWSPPSISFRATEIVLRYQNLDSGVRRATYSAFDKSTGILWILEYAAQHYNLDSTGEISAITP